MQSPNHPGPQQKLIPVPMMTPLAPLTRDLVLVGGGHAHALVLRMWGMNPLPGARLTVIDPGPAAPYSGMLPGLVAGHYAREELEIDLVRLCRFAGARLIMAHAIGIDATARRIAVEGKGEIGYDIASVDVGIHAAMPEIPGFAEHAIGAKPLGTFAECWASFRARALAGAVPPEVAVIGGGIAGIELILAMAHALGTAPTPPQLTLIEAKATLSVPTAAVRRRLMRALADHRVRVLTGARIARIGAGTITLESGEEIASHFTTGAAGARAHDWVARSNLPLTDDGFIRVRADLKVEGHDTLFAAGDCAHLTHAPRPKAGVFAVRAAPVLRDNLRAALSGGTTRAFHPQKHYLKLISLGGKSALAERGGFAVSGPALWRWKNRIDRRFIAKFAPLPEMPAPRPPRLAAVDDAPDAAPLCGGCGSKVAPGALSRVLSAQPAIARADILSGPGDDAAVITVGGATQVLTTDHLRAFTEDYGAMARIAALHALGDIWAMGARPQAAMVSLTLPRMSETLQTRTMEEIMREAGAALRDAGAEIVGGHSTMGAEMSIGFSLTGLLDRPAITTAGARPGDALILTRAIGTGTLLAAEMQGKADGRDIARLVRLLQRPQGDAAEILSRAHAMTDVTGFGLAGHLAAICRASGTGAWLDLASIPLLPGAEALAASGIRSTIWAANSAAAPVEGASGPRGALLHDPQTAGGLLAAVAADQVDHLLDALLRAGHAAALIGHMSEGAPVIRAT